MRPDPDRVAALLRETAEADILPRFRTLADDQVMEKKPGDLVTVADIEAERRLTASLSALVPGSVVVGEEAVHREASVLQRFEDDGPLWIIDPVDGTQNFVDGRTPFVIIVAFVLGGETRGAWIHDPVGDETAIAMEGEGAWRGETRLRVSPGAAINEMTGLINSNAYGRPHRDLVRSKKEAFGEIIRYRCAGHAYTQLAAGENHFSIYNRLWSWDHAAGILLHREAGGYSARVDGKPYRAGDRVEGLLSAPSRECWTQIHEFLKPD